jgi:3',5'-cyclic AMP phosphodiesterase CpdA
MLVQIHICAQSPSFTFIQLSDPQMGFISSNKDVEAEKELYMEVVNYVNRTKPTFVVITGDFVNNRTDTVQISAFKEITSLIDKKIPVYLVPGNHDIGQNPTEEQIDFYSKHYQSDRFSFNHEGVCFIGLNSCFIKANLLQEQEQLEWLKNIFKENQAKRKIIFTHHPFFTKNINEEENYSNLPLEKRKNYFQLFKENNVKVIFAGHYHNNASAYYDDMDMITTSSIGKQLGKVKPGFREITVYSDSIVHKYVEIGTLSDRPMSFILLGDLHYAKSEDFDMEWLATKPNDLRQVTETYIPNTEENWDDFMQIIADKSKSTMPPVKAIIQLGDLSEGLAGSEEKALQMVHSTISAVSNVDRDTKSRWLLTKGNHDITGPGAPEAFTQVYTPFIREQVNNPTIENASYSYRIGEALFVVLDLWDRKVDPVVFLEKELNESNARFKFVAVHEPIIPVTERCWHYLRRDPEKREKLLEVLAKNKVIVLCAHLHRYSVVKRETAYGPIIQVMVLSVVGNREKQTPTYQWTLEDYGPGLVDKLAFEPNTIEQRKQMLEEESKYVSYYKTCDLAGYGILKLNPAGKGEIKLYYYPAFGAEPYDVINLSELFSVKK